MTLTQIKPLGLSKPVDLADNEQIRLGTGNDLLIYHDGSNSYIKESASTSTGDLLIQANNIKLRNWDGGQTYLHGQSSGAVELYHDGNKKFETKSTGALITGKLETTGLTRDGDITFERSGSTRLTVDNGGITVGGDVKFNDNYKIKAGSSDDFELYHDGTDSYIAAHVTGNIFVRSRVGFFVNVNATAGGSEHAIKAFQNGAVELYYDHSKKFETTSTGVQASRYQFDADNYITCNTTANTMEIVTNGTDIGEFSPSGLMLRDNMQLRVGTGNDLRLYHDGSANYISNRTGNLYIEAKSGETAIQIIPDGAVDLRYDGTRKFVTQSDGVEILSTGSWHGLEVKHSNGNVVAKLQNKGSGDEGYLALYDSGGTGPSIQMDGEHGRLTCNQIRIGGNADANQLEDYEEGTFVPDFANVSNSDITVGYATYTKIGRLVYFDAKFTVNSSDGSGFGFTLPFGQAGSRRSLIPAISTRSGSTTTPFAFVINENQSYAYAKAIDGFSSTHVEYQDFNGDTIMVSGTFETT